MLDRLFAFAQRNPRTAVALALVLPPLLWYAPLILGTHTFPDGDFTHHFLPFSLYQQQALRELRLPLWNPATYGGHPFLADTQAAVFYPVSNLLLLLTLPFGGDAARLYWLQIEAVVHGLLAAWFVYLLVQELTASRWAALFAGLAFALSGYLIGYPPLQLAILRAAVWLPLILWLLLRGARAPLRLRWSLAAAAALACAFLAGHPQTFLHTAYATGAWALLLLVLVWRSQGSRAAAHFGAGLIQAALVAAGLSAAQILPSVEFAGLSVRSAVDYAYVSGGFPLRDRWQMILPGVFTWYSPLFLGVPALLAGAVGVVSVRSEPAAWRVPWGRAAALFFGGLALVALLIAYGGNGFLYPVVYWLLPGWKLFRGQERAAFLVVLALSVLAGQGAALLPLMRHRTRRRVGLVVAALVVAAVYAFGLFWQMQGGTVVSQVRYLWIAVVTLLAVSSAALALYWPGWSLRRSALLLATNLAGVGLLLFGTNFEAVNPATRVALAPEVVALQDAVAERSTTNLGMPGRVYNEFRTWEDYAMRAGVEDLWGSSPLRLERYARLAENFPLDRWWRLFGVEHVLTWRAELFAPATVLGQFPQTTDTTWLQRLANPNPRAWFVSSTRLADDAAALSLLADHEFDVETTVILPPESRAQEVQRAAGATAAITLERPVPERLHVRVETAAEGLLLLAENWMPGWRVEGISAQSAFAPIFGLPAFSVQRADLTLIAVPLPAGEHSFDLDYAPASATVGLWISGATLAVMALLLVGDALRRRRRTGA